MSLPSSSFLDLLEVPFSLSACGIGLLGFSSIIIIELDIQFHIFSSTVSHLWGSLPPQKIDRHLQNPKFLPTNQVNFISQQIKIEVVQVLLTIPISMKNKAPQNYQDLCSYAFKLFSLGLTNKQMADTEPQIKQYRLRELLEPSWDLVVEQMESAVSDHLRNIDTKIYQQAKFHFYCTIVSDKRYKYTGINNNSYGEKMTKSFIDACRHFEKEGTFDNYSSSEIVKLLKSIYKHYINEYEITQENLPKIDYFTEEETTKRRSFKQPKPKTIEYKSGNESSESQEAKSRRSASLLEDSKDQDNQAFELELKKKEIQRIKIEQEILLQKARMLDLQRQVLALEKGYNKTKKNQPTSNKSKADKNIPLQIQNPRQQPLLVSRKSILKKKGSVQSKADPKEKIKPESRSPVKAITRRSQEEDYLDEVYTEVDEDQELELEDEDYNIDDQESSDPIAKEKSPAKVKKSGKRITPEIKIASKEKQIKPFLKHNLKAPVTSIQKSSIQKYEDTYLKQEQIKKSKEAIKEVANKKIAPKLTRDEEEKIKKYKNPPKPLEEKEDIKSLIWHKEEQLFLLKFLKRSQSPQMNLSGLMVKKFGKKTRFQNANIRQKKYSIFKVCSKEFVNQLRGRKLFPNRQIDVIQEYLDNIDWRSSSAFVNQFMVQFYSNSYSRVSNEELRRFVDEMHSLKRKWQKITPKIQKNKNKIEPQQESSSKINQSVSNIQDKQQLKLETTNIQEEVREQKNPEVMESNSLSFKRRKQLQKVSIPKEIIASGKKQMAIRTMNQNFSNQSNPINVPSETNIDLKKSIKEQEEHNSKHIDLQKGGETSEAVQTNEIQAIQGIQTETKESILLRGGVNLKHVFEEHLSSLGQLKS